MALYVSCGQEADACLSQMRQRNSERPQSGQNHPGMTELTLRAPGHI